MLSDRTTGIRVPLSPPEARRIENRLAGMDCNPYLGIAASLAFGYLGLLEAENPRAECLGDAYMSEDELPTNLGDALDIMSESAPMRSVLPASAMPRSSAGTSRSSALT